MDQLLFISIGVAFVVLCMFFYYMPLMPWIAAKAAGVPISLTQLFLMRIRNIPPDVIMQAIIAAHKAGIELPACNDLQALHLTGGNVEKVVHALISASKANIDLTFKTAATIDLAGYDVFQAVQMAINPKVIYTPPITAVSGNGIRLIAKARITVRTNLKLLGGAGEETVLARVGEAIVWAVASVKDYEITPENPNLISELVLRERPDADTAYEILSIDLKFIVEEKSLLTS
jgi:uncharacterized protein YqfA (UPF0365 family)